MAEYVFTNGYYANGSTAGVGGTTLSDKVRQMRLRVSVDLQIITAMGDTWVTRLAGVKDWTAEIVFNQDFDASEVDATLWAILGTVTEITCRKDAAAVAVGNPNYYGNILIGDYPPIDGAHGEAAEISVTFQGAGTLIRATS